MREIIEEINLDLNRCENVLRDNNYLEVIIAIEELQDKYRDKIKSIGEKHNHVVWSYSIRDLKDIEDYLVKYKEELILKEKIENMYKKLSQLKSYVENNNIANKRDLFKIIDVIENVNNKNISLDEKYEELKECFDLVKTFEREVAISIFELIILAIN